MMYDYIIVGAGPAGCVCAGELKRKNYSVCVLEKQPEHYRKVCGDGISYVCVQALRSSSSAVWSVKPSSNTKWTAISRAAVLVITVPPSRV